MTGSVVAASVVAVAILMGATWVLSVVRRDASVVDVVWGLGFVLITVVSVAVGDGPSPRRLLLMALVGVWGLRLAVHIGWRNRGHGEDRRYQAMRARRGGWFWLISLITVFLLQGVLMLVVSAPVQLAAAATEPSTLGPLAVVGVAVWLVGLVFEAGGDLQLARFKADPANAGGVMDRGLWRYTRHPNYFGDCCVWWGIFLVAAETPAGRWGTIGPIVMTLFLLKVSGVALLERDIGERRPGYARYVERTSAFLPRRPRPTH